MQLLIFYRNIDELPSRLRLISTDCFADFKDTHMEKEPLNKTPALTKSSNMGIWFVGTWNQLFIRGS